MNRAIVTLRSAPSVSIDIPAQEEGAKQIQRSCFGAIRLFPGVPKAVTKDELDHIKATMPEVFLRLTIQPYVESKRVDLRGVAEADVSKLAAEEGIEHLSHARQVDLLRERGQIARPAHRGVQSQDHDVTEQPVVVRKPVAKRVRSGNGNK